MQVYGYGRVSTDEQAGSGLGIGAQRQAVEQAAAQRGWTTVCWHADEGYSGKDLARPAIAQLLDVLDRDGGVLIVAKLDRLSRSVHDFAGVAERARRHGWSLIVLDLGVDTSTPAGALMANVLASFAEYERLLIGARTRDALAQLKAQGVRLGRPVLLSTETRLRIADERAAGRSLRAIADDLTAEQIPTAQGGERWHASTVAAVLRSLDTDRETVAGVTGSLENAQTAVETNA